MICAAGLKCATVIYWDPGGKLLFCRIQGCQEENKEIARKYYRYELILKSLLWVIN